MLLLVTRVDGLDLDLDQFSGHHVVLNNALGSRPIDDPGNCCMLSFSSVWDKDACPAGMLSLHAYTMEPFAPWQAFANKGEDYEQKKRYVRTGLGEQTVEGESSSKRRMLAQSVAFQTRPLTHRFILQFSSLALIFFLLVLACACNVSRERAKPLYGAVAHVLGISVDDLQSRLVHDMTASPLSHKFWVRRHRGTYGPAINHSSGESFPGPQDLGIRGLYRVGDSTVPGLDKVFFLPAALERKPHTKSLNHVHSDSICMSCGQASESLLWQVAHSSLPTLSLPLRSTSGSYLPWRARAKKKKKKKKKKKEGGKEKGKAGSMLFFPSLSLSHTHTQTT